MSVKENIPILDTSESLSEAKNKGSKNITKNQSTTDNEIPTISDGVVNFPITDSNSVITKCVSQSTTESIDDKKTDIKYDKNRIQDKVQKYELY